MMQCFDKHVALLAHTVGCGWLNTYSWWLQRVCGACKCVVCASHKTLRRQTGQTRCRWEIAWTFRPKTALHPQSQCHATDPWVLRLKVSKYCTDVYNIMKKDFTAVESYYIWNYFIFLHDITIEIQHSFYKVTYQEYVLAYIRLYLICHHIAKWRLQSGKRSSRFLLDNPVLFCRTHRALAKKQHSTVSLKAGLKAGVDKVESWWCHCAKKQQCASKWREERKMFANVNHSSSKNKNLSMKKLCRKLPSLMHSACLLGLKDICKA